MKTTVPKLQWRFLKRQTRVLHVKAGKKILAQAPRDRLHLFVSMCVLIKSCHVFLHLARRMGCSPQAEQIFRILVSFVSQCVSQARFAPHISNLALKAEVLISCSLFLWYVMLRWLNRSQIHSDYFLPPRWDKRQLLTLVFIQGSSRHKKITFTVFYWFWLPRLGHLGSDISGCLAGFSTFYSKGNALRLSCTCGYSAYVQTSCQGLTLVPAIWGLCEQWSSAESVGAELIQWKSTDPKHITESKFRYWVWGVKSKLDN